MKFTKHTQQIIAGVQKKIASIEDEQKKYRSELVDECAKLSVDFEQLMLDGKMPEEAHKPKTAASAVPIAEGEEEEEPVDPDEDPDDDSILAEYRDMRNILCKYNDGKSEIERLAMIARNLHPDLQPTTVLDENELYDLGL